MNSPSTVLHLMPAFCRSALQLGLVVMARITPALLCGLMALRAVRRSDAGCGHALVNVTLAAVVGTVLFSIVLRGAQPALYTFSLPASASGQAGMARRPRPLRGGETGSQPTRVSVPAAGTLTADSRLQRSAPPISLVLSRLSSVYGQTMPATPSDLRPRIRFDREWLYALLAGIWALGTSLLLGWLAISWGYVQVLLRRCRPVGDAETLAMLQNVCRLIGVRTPRLLCSRSAQGPLLTGILRPTIVLPSTYSSDFNLQELRAVLTHEAAHMAQRDCVWTLITRLICALCWPHPLLWLLSRLRDEAGEASCDRAVLAQGCPPRDYARCLLALAERRRALSPESIVAAGVTPSRSSLARRLERLFEGERRLLRPTRAVRMLIGGSAIAVTLAGLFLVATASADRPHRQAAASGDRSTSKSTAQQDIEAMARSSAALQAADVPQQPPDVSALQAVRYRLAELQTAQTQEQEHLAQAQQAVRQTVARRRQAKAAQAQEHEQLAQAQQAAAVAAVKQAEAALAMKQANLRQLQVSLQQQQAQVNLAQVTYTRTRGLVAQGFDSQQDLDRAQAMLRSSQAGVAAAEASMQVAKANVAAVQKAVQSAQEEIGEARLQVQTAEAMHLEALARRDSDAIRQQFGALLKRRDSQGGSARAIRDLQAQIEQAQKQIARAVQNTDAMRLRQDQTRQIEQRLSGLSVQQKQIVVLQTSGKIALSSVMGAIDPAPHIEALHATFGDASQPSDVDEVSFTSTASAAGRPLRTQMTLVVKLYGADDRPIRSVSIPLIEATGTGNDVQRSSGVYRVPGRDYIASMARKVLAPAAVKRIEYHYELTVKQKDASGRDRSDTKQTETHTLQGDALVYRASGRLIDTLAWGSSFRIDWKALLEGASASSSRDRARP